MSSKTLVFSTIEPATKVELPTLSDVLALEERRQDYLLAAVLALIEARAQASYLEERAEIDVRVEAAVEQILRQYPEIQRVDDDLVGPIRQRVDDDFCADYVQLEEKFQRELTASCEAACQLMAQKRQAALQAVEDEFDRQAHQLAAEVLGAYRAAELSRSQTAALPLVRRDTISLPAIPLAQRETVGNAALTADVQAIIQPRMITQETPCVSRRNWLPIVLICAAFLFLLTIVACAAVFVPF